VRAPDSRMSQSLGERVNIDGEEMEGSRPGIRMELSAYIRRSSLLVTRIKHAQRFWLGMPDRLTGYQVVTFEVLHAPHFVAVRIDATRFGPNGNNFEYYLDIPRYDSLL